MVVKYVDISGALPDFDADAESAAAASDAASEAGSGDEASTPGGGGDGGRASTHGMGEWNALRQSGRHGPSWTERIGIAQVRGTSCTRIFLWNNSCTDPSTKAARAKYLWSEYAFGPPAVREAYRSLWQKIAMGYRQL